MMLPQPLNSDPTAADIRSLGLPVYYKCRLFTILSTVCSAVHNVTIENDTGDAVTGLLPVYEPMNMWTPQELTPRQGDTNPYNVTAAVSITTSSPTSETWMSLLFQGTAIYVSFVLISGATQLNFVMDGEPLQYEFDYTETAHFAYYNATVYSNSSLTSTGTGLGGFHNLTISSQFLMSFDFAKYTVLDAIDNQTTSPAASLTATSNSIVGMSTFGSAVTQTSIPMTSSSIFGVSPFGSAVTRTPIPKPHSALSGGAIAGISIGAVLAIITLVFILYRFAKDGARPSWSIPPDPFLSQQSKRQNVSKEPLAAVVPPSSDATGSPNTQKQRRSTPMAVVEERNSLRAQLAHLQAHTQSQATVLQAQIARIEAQLSSGLIVDEPPPSYQRDFAAPVPE